MLTEKNQAMENDISRFESHVNELYQNLSKLQDELKSKTEYIEGNHKL